MGCETGSQCSDLYTWHIQYGSSVYCEQMEDGLCVVACVAGPVLLPALSRLEHIFQESMIQLLKVKVVCDSGLLTDLGILIRKNINT